MSEPAGSNKRQRTNSDTSGPEKDGPNPIKRDDEFWFEDGNIVLIARDIEFRVYKGILAKHSSVFQDMFSLPPPVRVAPEPSQDMAPPAGACPVVHLSDSPEDLRHVLRVCMSDTNLRQVSRSMRAAHMKLILFLPPAPALSPRADRPSTWSPP